jgi:hypothetical protein
MKKLFFLFTLCFSLMSAFAQTGSQTNVTDTSCFCCNGFYALPKPVITGPTVVKCGEKPVYTVKACPGATITWSVTAPNSIATGQGTNTIALNPVSGAAYSVAVQIRCGNKVVETKISVQVIQIPNCSPKFEITVKQLPNGNFQVTANPLSGNVTAGVQHYWGLVGNGNGSTCTAIPLNQIQTGGTFGISISSTGICTPVGMGTGLNCAAGYGYQYNGLGNVGCYKLTHYINCCGEWLRQTQCFCVSFSNGRVMQPTITTSEVEKVPATEIPKGL